MYYDNNYYYRVYYAARSTAATGVYNYIVKMHNIVYYYCHIILIMKSVRRGV